jgi:glutamyl-tRNA synthetase
MPSLASAINTVKTRATTLVEAAQMVDFYYRDVPTEDEKAVAKFLVPESKPNLEALRAHLAAQPDFSRSALEAETTVWMIDRSLELKHIAQPARVALTGKEPEPGPLRDARGAGQGAHALVRLDRAIARCST